MATEKQKSSLLWLQRLVTDAMARRREWAEIAPLVVAHLKKRAEELQSETEHLMNVDVAGSGGSEVVQVSLGFQAVGRRHDGNMWVETGAQLVLDPDFNGMVRVYFIDSEVVRHDNRSTVSQPRQVHKLLPISALEQIDSILEQFLTEAGDNHWARLEH